VKPWSQVNLLAVSEDAGRDYRGESTVSILPTRAFSPCALDIRVSPVYLSAVLLCTHWSSCGIHNRQLTIAPSYVCV
jgi:hypothetical protein